MSILIKYLIIALIIIVLELAYFKIAAYCNIIDRPNQRSSHSSMVLRGGGVVFMLGLWVWVAFFGMQYLWFLLALTLVAAVSFIDDIHSLSDGVRLVAQSLAMVLMFHQLGLWGAFDFSEGLSIYGALVPLLVLLLALIVCLGASNIINFMDGVNGITGAYAMASLLPLFLLNRSLGFVAESLIVVVALADITFCLFNLRPRGRAKCFAGDVGSMSVAFILLFLIGSLIIATGDITYLIFLVVYGVDGCLTIVHRLMLHENIGEAHRKHAYQLMANELKIGHVKVALLYASLQLVISLAFICACPDNLLCHTIFLVSVIVILSVAYIFFMKRYYHLHEEYLASLTPETK